MRFLDVAIVSGAALALQLGASSATARTWRVTPDGIGADAPTIQAGVDSAQAGDEVVLAPGTYTTENQASAGFSLVHLKPGITLRSEAGAAATSILSTTRAIRLVETGLQTRIEGLTIRGRVALGDPDAGGGGLLILGTGTPAISGCVFTSCAASLPASGWGGAIYCSDAVEPAIESCDFTSCVSLAGIGGALYCSRATVRNCRFTNNRSYYSGGAVACGAATFESCEFRSNLAAGDPGGSGGAIASQGASMSHCRFEDNSAGGPFSGSSGAVAGALQVADCYFALNTTSSFPGAPGGALTLRPGGTVTRSIFVGNAAQLGGAISMSSGTVSQCLFVSNAVSGSSSPAGGAIHATGTAVIESCTFLDNRATPATSVGAIATTGPATIRNCIIAGTAGRVCPSSSAATWICCDLYSNSGGNAICGTDGGGNFSADPQFCSADPIASLNVLLQGDSPCAPGGHPDGAACGLIGVAPVGCGSVAVEQRTWSAMKQLYRD